MPDPTMYIIINKGLGMSSGKIAAQAAHAAVEAYRVTPAESNLLRLWHRSGHYKKIVLQARDEAHMRNIHDYLEDRGVRCVKIIDEGHTEVKPLSLTALGCEIVDKQDPHTKGIFEAFELYKDEPKPQASPIFKIQEPNAHEMWPLATRPFTLNSSVKA